MRIIITGYKGFIGKYITELLKKSGHQLYLYDISDGIDLTDQQHITNFPKADKLIHLANLSYVPASYENPHQFYKTNFLSTLNMLEYCRLNNTAFVYFSSYMYGVPDYQPIDEAHPRKAYNPYAQTKLIAENLCEGYHRDFAVPITIFRPFNIYGNDQNPDFLIPTIIQQVKSGKISIRDDRPKRDYIHVTDVAEAVLLAIEKLNEGYQVYNLGSAKSYSVKQVIEFVCRALNIPFTYTCTNEFRASEVLDTISDITKIQTELGWQPKISFEEGIKQLINT